MPGNRLAEASSPYLKQHADNPVHWQPWDDEAFEQARREDKPIFLSVGYSSCHWCHVMEHESFMDEEIAEILNRSFVSIKVDREERPDVDEVYMTAVQLSSGQGGWPMTVFMTPDRKPFFAGTYFPPEDRGQYPGFKSLLTHVADAWKQRQPELLKAADEFAQGLEHALEADIGVGERLDWELIEAALARIKENFDWAHGAFGLRPKFPPHQALALWLYLAERHAREDCLEMAVKTLDAMLLGGIHDHVGGGFHRYSTDERWLVPHFEKMLYDNGLLLRNYAVAERITGNPEYRRACDRLVGWLEREMRSPEGTFYSALDADSEGEEGKFYTWTADEVRDVLGEEAPAFVEAFSIEDEGNYLDEAMHEPTGRNIGHLSAPQGGRFDESLRRLLERRGTRTRPGLDDKVLASWNGLVISGLAAAGYFDIAERAAGALLSAERVPHQFVQGRPEGEPFLDLAYLVEGFLDLSEATGKGRWRGEAERLFERMFADFHDDSRGGWFFTSPRHERLFGRSKPALDQATPSPNAVIIRCALRLGRTEVAEKDLEALLGWIQRAPLAAEASILAAAMYLDCRPERAAARPIEAPGVRMDVQPKEARLENGKVSYTINVSIPEGCHINSAAPPDPNLIGTEVSVAGFRNWSVDVPREPEPLTGRVAIQVRGEPPEGKEGEAKALITFQLCTETECLPPETKELSLVWYRE